MVNVGGVQSPNELARLCLEAGGLLNLLGEASRKRLGSEVWSEILTSYAFCEGQFGACINVAIEAGADADILSPANDGIELQDISSSTARQVLDATSFAERADALNRIEMLIDEINALLGPDGHPWVLPGFAFDELVESLRLPQLELPYLFVGSVGRPRRRPEAWRIVALTLTAKSRTRG